MDSSIGELLARTREIQGKTIEDVERATKIRSRYIEALETNRFDIIPGDVYVKGFIKSYAAFLGLDPEPLVHIYQAEFQHPLRLESATAPGLKTEVEIKTRPRWLTALIVVLAIAFAFVGLLIWGSYVSRTPTNRATLQRSSSSTTEAKMVAPAAPVTSTTSSTTSTTVTTLAKGVSLRLTATDEKGSWLRVEADGQHVFEGILAQNEEKVWTARERIFVRSGNARGVVVELNGRSLGLFDDEPGVVEKLFTAEGTQTVEP